MMGGGGGGPPWGRTAEGAAMKGGERTAQGNFCISPFLSTSPALPWLSIMLYRLSVLDTSIGDGPGRKIGGDTQTPHLVTAER